MKVSFELMFEIEETERNEEKAESLFNEFKQSITQYLFNGNQDSVKWLYNDLVFMKEVKSKENG